ncbi:MAG TPA: sulfite exporter TauE/SafE family protein [Euzebya sp.]|nr:sulfite exporter TauE/SafE family protein [Euzebya sp.]
MSVVEVIVVAIAALLGGAAQSMLGFGAAFTTVPVLAVVAPQLLPGAALVAFLPLAGLMALRERRHVDRQSALRLSVARIPGILSGAVAVKLLEPRGLAMVVAVIMLLAVGSVVAGWSFEPTPSAQRLAGAVSGFAGTSVGLGGPPLAVLYRDRPPAESRPTLAIVFASGIMMSLAALAVSGSFSRAQMSAGALISLAILSGMVMAAPLLRRVDDATIRRWLLAWAAAGSLLALLRVLFG